MARLRELYKTEIPIEEKAQKFNDAMWNLFRENNLPATIRPGAPENYNFSEDLNNLLKQSPSKENDN